METFVIVPRNTACAFWAAGNRLTARCVYAAPYRLRGYSHAGFADLFFYAARSKAESRFRYELTALSRRQGEDPLWCVCYYGWMDRLLVTGSIDPVRAAGVVSRPPKRAISIAQQTHHSDSLPLAAVTSAVSS